MLVLMSDNDFERHCEARRQKVRERQTAAAESNASSEREQEQHPMWEEAERLMGKQSAARLLDAMLRVKVEAKANHDSAVRSGWSDNAASRFCKQFQRRTSKEVLRQLGWKVKSIDDRIAWEEQPEEVLGASKVRSAEQSAWESWVRNLVNVVAVDMWREMLAEWRNAPPATPRRASSSSAAAS